MHVTWLSCDNNVCITCHLIPCHTPHYFWFALSDSSGLPPPYEEQQWLLHPEVTLSSRQNVYEAWELPLWYPHSNAYVNLASADLKWELSWIAALVVCTVHIIHIHTTLFYSMYMHNLCSVYCRSIWRMMQVCACIRTFMAHPWDKEES